MFFKLGIIRKELISRRIVRLLKKWKSLDIVLLLIPVLMVIFSGILIASTQRQADFADWYHHWITKG